MKLRHMLTGALFTVILLTATASTAFAAVSKGRFESVDETSIRGWAYNSDDSEEALMVKVTVRNQETGEEVFTQRVTANEYREDLEAQNKGNGCHGFTISMDWTALPDGVYEIEGSTDGRAFSNTRTYTHGDPEAAKAQEQAPAAGQLIPLGQFKTTAYCPCRGCSEGWGRHTSTGALATAGRTIAVDPRVIPYGTQVMINGVVYTAEDKGGGVKGNHIDIFYDTHAETRIHGTQVADVYLVQA